MDFFDAMQEMKKGAKVRIVGWDQDKFIGLSEETVKIFGNERKKYEVLDNHELTLSPCVSFPALLSADWEIFVDKKDDVIKGLAALLAVK